MEFSSINHHTKFELNQFIHDQTYANVFFFFCCCFFLNYLFIFLWLDVTTIKYLNNLCQRLYQDVQLELFHHHAKFHPIQLESVRENEQRGFPLHCVTPGQVKVTEQTVV